MEYTFTQLKQKEVVDIASGKNLGKICDVQFSIPENKLLAFTVTGGKSFIFARKEITIPICSVTKIGEDTILVKLETKPQSPPPDKHPPKPSLPTDCCQPPHRRSYDEYE